MGQTTAKYELLELKLELTLQRKLREYVDEARQAGRGWRTIATELQTTTGVEVSWETLRSWFTEPAGSTEPAEPVEQTAKSA